MRVLIWGQNPKYFIFLLWLCFDLRVACVCWFFFSSLAKIFELDFFSFFLNCGWLLWSLLSAALGNNVLCVGLFYFTFAVKNNRQPPFARGNVDVACVFSEKSSSPEYPGWVGGNLESWCSFFDFLGCCDRKTAIFSLSKTSFFKIEKFLNGKTK